MKKYRISLRRFRKIIKSYQSCIDLYRDLNQSANRDSQHYFDLWLEQLEISAKLRKWLLIDSIMLILISLWMLVLLFFGV